MSRWKICTKILHYIAIAIISQIEGIFWTFFENPILTNHKTGLKVKNTFEYHFCFRMVNFSSMYFLLKVFCWLKRHLWFQILYIAQHCKNIHYKFTIWLATFCTSDEPHNLPIFSLNGVKEMMPKGRRP